MAENNLDKPIELKVDSEQMVDKWAIIVMDRWMQALDKYKVGVTGALMNSFYKELKIANGDVDAVILKFLKYGRFVDMGVGRGVSLGERVLNRKFDRYRTAGGSFVNDLERKKKPWYSKTFYREVAKLADLYQKEYGDQLLKVIESGLNTSLNLSL